MKNKSLLLGVAVLGMFFHGFSLNDTYGVDVGKVIFSDASEKTEEDFQDKLDDLRNIKEQVEKKIKVLAEKKVHFYDSISSDTSDATTQDILNIKEAEKKLVEALELISKEIQSVKARQQTFYAEKKPDIEVANMLKNLKTKDTAKIIPSKIAYKTIVRIYHPDKCKEKNKILCREIVTIVQNYAQKVRNEKKEGRPVVGW